METVSGSLVDVKLWPGKLVLWRMRTGFGRWWFERTSLVRV